MRAGAKSIGRDVAGRVRSTLGGVGGVGGRGKKEDVWDTATTEELTDEPPECQWCPICRAARRYRDAGGTSGPGTSGQFTSVGDTLAGLTRDAFSLFDAALRPPQRPTPPASRPAGRPADPSDHGPVVGAGAGVGWPAVVHPQHDEDEAADERGDRQEGGQPGDGGAGGGADEQVERTAE